MLNKNQVTAKELAERFEVSVRTIYRDIEALCEAGIPIYTTKGKGGGISLLDHFILNKSVLSAEEQQEILAALQGLSAVSFAKSKTLSKLDALFGNEEADWIQIDFAGWNQSIKEKFETLKSVILGRKVIQFEYYNANMERTVRAVEPLQLSFIDKTWYLKGYCRMKQGIRLFKLSRIKEIRVKEEHFERQLPVETQKQMSVDLNRKTTVIKLWIDASQAYRAYDEFEEQQITLNKDGSFQVEISYPLDEWVYGYLLSYGPYLRVLEPAEVRDELIRRLKRSLELYDDSKKGQTNSYN